MIHVRSVSPNDVDKAWLGEAFMFNSHRNNFAAVGMIAAFPMFIVHKDNKDIGFFLLHVDEIASEVSATYWAHPRYCRMNMLPIIQSATVGIIKYALDNRIQNIMLRIEDGLPCRLIKKMYQGFETYKLRPGYNLVFGYVNSIKLLVEGMVRHNDDGSYEVDI